MPSGSDADHAVLVDLLSSRVDAAGCVAVLWASALRWGGLHASCEPGSSATVVDEPGVTCTVRQLATALNRIELGCARCMYLLEWP